MAAFVLDLQRYQSGLAVTAHRDTLSEIIARWYRRHSRAVWAGALVGSIILILGGLLYGERLKEMAEWGSPVVSEDFRDDGWKQAWRAVSGRFEQQDGHLVTKGGENNVLFLNQRMQGDTAIEFEGTMLPGSPAGDLSILWQEDLDPTVARKRMASFDQTYTIQVGGGGGRYCTISIEGRHLTYSAFKPELGRRYRVRAEISGHTMVLLVDGRRICTYRSPFPFSGGYVGLYGYYAGKAFTGVRVQALSVPQKVAATAIGDALFQEHLWGAAGAHYAKVAACHPGSQLAAEAIFKQGLCAYSAGEYDRAFLTWDGLESSRWEFDARMYRMDRWFALGDHGRVISNFVDWYKTGNEDERLQLVLRWEVWADQLSVACRANGDGSILDQYLDLHAGLFNDLEVTNRVFAGALLALERFEEILKRCPNETLRCADALRYLGREEEALTRFPNDHQLCIKALSHCARWDEIAIRYPDEPISQTTTNYALIMSGHPDEVLVRDPTNVTAMQILGKLEETVALGRSRAYRDAAARCLLQLGRGSELSVEERNNANSLMGLGEYQEALSRYGGDYFYSMWPRHMFGLQAFIAGRHEEAFKLFEMPPTREFHQHNMVLLQYVMVPFLQELSGKQGALREKCSLFLNSRRYIHEQRPWHNAMYLLGQIDQQTYLSQPSRVFAPADRMVLDGVRCDLEGKAEAALREYRGYLDIPLYRRGTYIEPVINRFVEWRVEILAKAR
jgi:hypothetical protein